MELAGKDPSLFLQNVVKYTNEYSIVVQEYFQKRVDIWLQTVGRKVFHIKHYWIRFEFAPSRGQIHAHMLVICDRTFISPLEQHIAKHPQQKTQILSEWVQRSFDMTSLLNLDMQGNDTLLTCQHPSSIYYSEASDKNVDQFLCQTKLQYHECSSYCLQKSTIYKDTRWCNKTCSHEKTPGKGDTAGYKIIQKPEIVSDPRGYHRLELPRNHPRIVQTSMFLLREWRANVDIQFLVYEDELHNTTASEISHII